MTIGKWQCGKMPFNAIIVSPLSGGGVDVLTSLITVVTSVVTGPTVHTSKYILFGVVVRAGKLLRKNLGF